MTERIRIAVLNVGFMVYLTKPGSEIIILHRNFQKLELSQYVNIIKLVNFDPQKIGKDEVFYKEAEATFDKIVA